MLETRNFLVPDATFVIEMVAFIAVLVVMTRYVVPRIRLAMHQRQHSITAALAAADAAERRLDTARAEAAEIKAEARREARATSDQARAMRDHLIAEGRAVGAEEYRWLAGRAAREMERRSDLSSQHLRQRARTVAIAAAKAYLGDDVDVASLAHLVDEQLDALDTTGRHSAAAAVQSSVVSPPADDDAKLATIA